MATTKAMKKGTVSRLPTKPVILEATPVRTHTTSKAAKCIQKPPFMTISLLRDMASPTLRPLSTTSGNM